MMADTVVHQILSAVTYKDWWLLVTKDRQRGDAYYIQWHFKARCVKTGGVYEQKGRKWYLSPYMTESELVGTAFKAALTAEEHECRESFNYYGHRVFNPHVDVRALLEVCDREDVREEPTA